MAAASPRAKQKRGLGSLGARPPPPAPPRLPRRCRPSGGCDAFRDFPHSGPDARGGFPPWPAAEPAAGGPAVRPARASDAPVRQFVPNGGGWLLARPRPTVVVSLSPPKFLLFPDSRLYIYLLRLFPSPLAYLSSSRTVSGNLLLVLSPFLPQIEVPFDEGGQFRFPASNCCGGRSGRFQQGVARRCRGKPDQGRHTRPGPTVCA